MKKQYFKYLGALLGAAAGFLYWNSYSCEHGCAITSKWWATMILFAVIAYQIADFGYSLFDKKSSTEK